MVPSAESSAVPAAVARLGPAAVVGAVIVGLAFAQGGFFAQSWGWSALVLLLLAFVGVTLRGQVDLTSLEAGAIAAMAGLALWTLLSALWSDGTTLPVDGAERLLVYLATLLACLLAVRRDCRAAVPVAVWIAVTLVGLYSLGTRLAPQRWGFFVDSAAHGRLFQPVGYWNGLAVIAAIGVLLALGLAARSPLMWLRFGAAASLPVNASVLYLTFSRGAWLGLTAGIVAVIAVDRRRLDVFTRMALLGAPSVLAIAAASRSHGLTAPNQRLAHAVHAGERYLAVVVVMVVVSAAVAAWLWTWREWAPSAGQRRAYIGLLVALAVLVCAGAVDRAGAPWSWPHKVYVQTGSDTDTTDLQNLNQRLGSASLSGRGPLWHAALDEFRGQPLAGGGAGSFAAYWAQNQTSPLDATNPHSLYLETLAELGLVGLALLVALAGCIIAGGIRARARPQAPFWLGVVIAYLVAASTDWDWQMAGVTVPMLACGTALLGGSPRFVLAPGRARIAAMAVAAALMLAAGVGLVGNVYLDRSYAALRAGHAAAAISDAGTAHTWMPWSSEALAQRARAEFAAGDRVAALRSVSQAIARSPDDWSLWLLEARVAPPGAGRDALARAVALKPSLPTLLHR